MSQLVRRTAIAVAGLAAAAGSVAPAAGAARSLLGAVPSSAAAPHVQAPALPVPVPVPALPQVAAPPTPPVHVPPPPLPAQTLPRVEPSIPAGSELFRTASFAPRASYAGSSGTTGGAGSAATAAGQGGAAPAARQASEAKAARVLRSRVARLGPCFGALPPLERKLIALRAGMRGSPLSLAKAARVVRLPLARARRIELHARAEIADLLRNGCRTALAPSAASWAAPMMTSVSAGPVVVPAAELSAASGSSAPAARPRPQHGVKGAEASSDALSRSVPATAVPPTISGSLVSAQLAGGDSSLLAAILAAAAPALLAAMILLLRGRRRREPHPAAAAAATPARAERSSPVFLNPAAAELIERHGKRRRESGEDD